MEKYYQQCQECGGHAFEYKKRPQPGQPMFAEDIVGENYQPGDEIICQECNLPMAPADLNIKNLVVVDAKKISVQLKGTYQPWKWLPHRLTLATNPPIYIWLFWVISYNKLSK